MQSWWTNVLEIHRTGVEMTVKAKGPHGITEYRSGCRCNTCRAAAAQAKRRQRAARPDGPRGANVLALPTTVQPAQTAEVGPGPVEAAVRAELGPLAESHPVIVAQAIAVAAKIDDPAHAALIARNSNELDKLRAELRGPRRKMGARGNKLSVVNSMAGRRQWLSDSRRDGARPDDDVGDNE